MRLLIGIMTVTMAVLAGPALAQSDPRPHGLLWHRSGLPAVFPLQIRSHAGEDYYFRLFDVESGKAVLAAYLQGGRFFRVLVPPGTFELRFAAGRGWQGEEALFGPGDETRLFTLPEPFTFAVRNFNTKGGHLIDLTKTGAGEMARVMPLGICQVMQVIYEDAHWPWPFGADEAEAARRPEPLRPLRYHIRSIPC